MPLSIDTLSPAALAKSRMFDIFELVDRSSRGGKVTIFERVRPGVDYGLGFDPALGISGRDRDAICVFGKFQSDKTASGYRIRQVAQIYGWWGERVHRVVYAAHRYFNGALILGERQGGGLATMRRLVDEYGCHRPYYDRAEVRKGRNRSDVLGIHRGTNDVTLNNFRLAFAERAVSLRSRELVEEMAALQWVSRRKEDKGRSPDEKLVLELLAGGSPDLVMSACYGYHAARHLHLFQPERKPDPEELPEDMREKPEVSEARFGRKRR